MKAPIEHWLIGFATGALFILLSLFWPLLFWIGMFAFSLGMAWLNRPRIVRPTNSIAAYLAAFNSSPRNRPKSL